MILLLLALLGVCFGSFVNALVWRIHEQQKPKAKRAKANLSITKGRSVCTHCGHILQPIDLIPVLSWVMLKGRCRYCGKPIGWQYPVVELATAGLFMLSYLVWPYGFEAIGIFQLVVWLVLLVGLVALAVYDLRWMLLPDRIVAPLAVVAGAQVFVLAVWQKDVSLLWGAVWGVLCLAGFFYVLFQISRGKWIGGGDVKLGVVLGLIVGGPVASLAVLFIASLIGTVCSLPLLIKGRKAMASKLPFGPFLIVATIIVYLFGASLIAWYKRQFLLL